MTLTIEEFIDKGLDVSVYQIVKENKIPFIELNGDKYEANITHILFEMVDGYAILKINCFPEIIERINKEHNEIMQVAKRTILLRQKQLIEIEKIENKENRLKKLKRQKNMIEKHWKNKKYGLYS